MVKLKKVITSMPSLKNFHIFFVAVSMIFLSFLILWTFNNSSMLSFYLSIFMFIGISFYGFLFYNKLKKF